MPPATDTVVPHEADSGLSSWMKDLPQLDGNPPPAAGAKAEPPNPPPGSTPPAAAPAKPAAASTEPPKAPAAAEPPKPAAPEPKPAEKAPDASEEDEKWPRSGDDWAKLKAKQKERETRLKTELETREARIAEFETRAKKLEEELEQVRSKAGQPDPETQAKLERLTKENEELSERLAITEVTAHPKFKQYFDTKVSEQMEIVKDIFGDKADAVKSILDLPPGEYKELRIEELVSDLNPLQTSQFGSVLLQLRAIEREKQAEIKRANEHRSKLDTDRTAAQEKRMAENRQIFANAVKEVQDAKAGMAVFQPRDGDPKWNEAVKARIAEAEKICFGGEGMTPQTIAKAALRAAAMPVILESYKAHMEEKDAEIAKLSEQVKALSKSQPAVAGGGTGGGTEPQPVAIKRGMSPMEASAAFFKNLHADE